MSEVSEVTALDMFRRYANAKMEIADLEERIERRKSMVMGGAQKPLSHDGGSRGGYDPSMRLLDYVENVEELRKRLEDRKQKRDGERACCLYLAEMLPVSLSNVMVRIYLEEQTLAVCAKEMNYSVSQIKRFKRDAEGICRWMNILSWDGFHVPLISFPQMGTDIPGYDSKMIFDDP